MNKTNEPTEKNMETKTPINQRIDKTKLEKHPSGDGWLVPIRSGRKAWVITFNNVDCPDFPIRGLNGIRLCDWHPNGRFLDSDREDFCDLMLDAYIDPYAELKAAHAAGKVIQCKIKGSSTDNWSDCRGVMGAGKLGAPKWVSHCEYRIKPDWTLGRSVNGFTLGEGQEWHRNDWTEDMLPDGWRPLMHGERDGYDVEEMEQGKWKQCKPPFVTTTSPYDEFQRTRRPLPEVKKPVPLGPEDITPGSCVRYIGKPFWTAIESISSVGIVLRTGFYSYEKIKGELEISRDGGKTWEACSK